MGHHFLKVQLATCLPSMVAFLNENTIFPLVVNLFTMIL